MEAIADLDQHRRALTGHCYRMLGSVVDADDAVQETFVRAWRGQARFEGRAAVRTWLYRIATNVCLDALAQRKRRARPMEEGPAGSVDSLLTQRPRSHWLEPIAEAAVMPPDADPHERAVLRESTRLAFVHALQHLAPRQRAALLLSDVLGCSATEVASCLETSVAAVNSALQRARAKLAEVPPNASEPLTGDQAHMLDRFVAAFERFDVEELVGLLRDDATFSMPPYALWLQGPDAVQAWLWGPGLDCRGSRLVPTVACGGPAFGQYRLRPEGGYFPWALTLLELDGARIAGWNSFLDTDSLFPRFGLPASLE